MDTKERTRPAAGGKPASSGAAAGSRKTGTAAGSGKSSAAAAAKKSGARSGNASAAKKPGVRPGNVSAAKSARPAAGTKTAGTKKSSTGRRPAAKRAPDAPVYKRKRPRPQRKQQRAPSVEVVYTQPEPFNRSRFLLRLLTAAAVVLALFLGMSIFFRVETVMVSGADKYTPWQIREASGIEVGENLLGLNEARIGGKIKTALPYVSRVRVGIKLPATVNIEVAEIAVTYAVESVRDGWWLVTADGKVMESVSNIDAGGYTQILGVMLESPIAGGNAVVSEPNPPAETTQQTSTPEESTPAATESVNVSAAEQFRVALDIVQYLEDNGVLGVADSVDVSDLGQLTVWYGKRQYQVMLGDTTRLGYKIEMMKNTIDQLGEHYSGILDVSYTFRPQEVVYTPFS